MKVLPVSGSEKKMIILIGDENIARFENAKNLISMIFQIISISSCSYSSIMFGKKKLDTLSYIIIAVVADMFIEKLKRIRFKKFSNFMLMT